jgi:transcriptional regulator with XRE-family HTH domain
MAPPGNEMEPMTPDEFKGWMARLGLTQVQIAERLETTQPTVSKWVRGQHEIPGHLRLALERLEQILAEERRSRRRRPRAVQEGPE